MIVSVTVCSNVTVGGVGMFVVSVDIDSVSNIDVWCDWVQWCPIISWVCQLV